MGGGLGWRGEYLGVGVEEICIRETGGDGMEDEGGMEEEGRMKEGVGVEQNMRFQGWNVLNTTVLLDIML